MYVHFGQRPFGKCDVVPELFYVATFFFHINFVPLIPLKSHIIFGQSGTTYQAVPIPICFKSILYAWVRTALFITSVAAWIVAFIAMSERHPPGDNEMLYSILFASLFTVLFLFVMIYPRRVKPSYERACKLAQLAGLNERAWAALNVLYDRHPLDRPETTGFQS